MKKLIACLLLITALALSSPLGQLADPNGSIRIQSEPMELADPNGSIRISSVELS